MEDLVVPNTFSNLAHEYVYKTKKNSLFFVKVSVNQAQAAHVLHHLKDKFHMSDEAANELIGCSKMATGFVVLETESTYYVLTCAHAFEDYYSAEVQINRTQLNSWFHVLVVCQHYEKNMIKNFPNLYDDPNVDPRLYSPATVSRFSQNKDLMLLSVSKNYLRSGINLCRCEMPHPALCPPRNISQSLNDVTMVSWPPCRKDTPVIGQMISRSRVYRQITRDLSKGYDMNLIEMDITGDDGSSGAPILNHHGHYISMYHGRLNSVGYGISVGDIYQFCQGIEV